MSANYELQGASLLTSSSNGYPKSIIACLLTSLAGILVFPFFGNSLLTVTTLSLLLEELTLLLLTLPLWL